jgi:hypothetical protein
VSTPPEERDDELIEAGLRAEAATDALVTFLDEAIGAIKLRCPEWYEQIERRREESEARLEEARRLVQEAEYLVGETTRMRSWLDRFSGVSALGLIPFGILTVPGPGEEVPDEALDMTVNVT